MTDTRILLDQLRAAAVEATRPRPASRRVFGVDDTETEFTRESEDFGFVWAFFFGYEGPAPHERQGYWEISHCELRNADGTVIVEVPLKAFPFQALEDIRSDIIEALRVRHQVNRHE